ncbi:hypothetical protein GAGA_4070 [Paraglaciecola agarilytica NO2]|uniref:Uncharacterized protein n=1 Tax=Paraglaciecola agarilytica NO2 TaxID=1125747 RepID=A0ABQ0ICA6_9ALTE|nr:hypothetical protein GAGA_4070 [Paraglaciecola agarilytica NO2]
MYELRSSKASVASAAVPIGTTLACVMTGNIKNDNNVKNIIFFTHEFLFLYVNFIYL